MPNRLRGCGRYMQSVIIPGDACVVCGWDRDKCLSGPAEERAAAAAAAPPKAAQSTRGSTRHRAGGTNKTSSNHTAVKAAVGAAQRNRKTLPKGGAGTGRSPSKASEQTTSMGVDKHRLAATNVMYHGSVLIGGQNSGKGSTHTRIDKRNHGGGYHTKTRQPRSEKPDTSAAVAAANQAAAATRERQDKLEQHAAEADRLARERQAHMDAEMDRQKRHHGYAHARRTARPASPASSYSSYATHSDVHTNSPEPQAQASSPAPVQTRVGTYKPRTRTTKPAHATISAGAGAGAGRSTRSGAWSDRSDRSDRTDRADTASTRGQRQTATPQHERSSYTPQATSRRPDSAESAGSSTIHRPATAWSPRPKAATTSTEVTTARYHHHHHRSSSKRPGTASRKTPAVTSRTAQQAAMLSMAADAARNQGDMSSAQGLYEKTADLFETLGLEEQYAKENKKTGNRHHHHRHNHGGSSRHGPGHGHGHGHSHSRSNSRHHRHNDYRDDWYGDGSGSGGSTSRRSNDPERAERKWMAVTMERSWKEDGSGRTKTGDTMTGSSSDSTLLRAAQFDEGQQTLLRKLFATYSQGPTLSSSQLAKCLADHGCRGSASAYFSAFDRNGNRTWIDSSDFLVGIAALDPLTPHTGPWLAERARLIFRFYASGSSNMLMKQLVQVIDDGSYIAGDSHESPEQRARILNPGGGHVNQRKFVASVVNGEIPGTSGLFRYSILQHMM